MIKLTSKLRYKINETHTIYPVLSKKEFQFEEEVIPPDTALYRLLNSTADGELTFDNLRSVLTDNSTDLCFMSANVWTLPR
jgi:hypothetical protein